MSQAKFGRRDRPTGVRNREVQADLVSSIFRLLQGPPSLAIARLQYKQVTLPIRPGAAHPRIRHLRQETCCITVVVSQSSALSHEREMRSRDLKPDAVSEAWAFQRFEFVNGLGHSFIAEFKRRSTLAPRGLIGIIDAWSPAPRPVQRARTRRQTDEGTIPRDQRSANLEPSMNGRRGREFAAVMPRACALTYSEPMRATSALIRSVRLFRTSCLLEAYRPSSARVAIRPVVTNVEYEAVMSRSRQSSRANSRASTNAWS